MADIATIDALVHGKQSAVSFRHLSSLLKIPARAAQNLLVSYLATQAASSLTVLWCVTAPNPSTGHIQTRLTSHPPPEARKQIWAVGPAEAATAPSPHAVWIAPDTARDRDLVSQPSHHENELRDGRFNRIVSSTYKWNSRLDPRLEGNASLSTALPKRTSTLLSTVKSKTKGKTKSKNRPSAFSFKPKSAGRGPASSLFSSKPLGASAVASIKATEKEKGEDKSVLIKSKRSNISTLMKKGYVNGTTRENGRKPPSAKKARRVIAVSDNEEEQKEVEGEEPEEEELDEEEQQRRELEQEDAQREAEDADKEELQREVKALSGQSWEEPESPELRDVDEKYEVKDDAEPCSPAKSSSATPESGKRTIWEALGEAPGSGRRIRKEVTETVVGESGYIVTRNVVKIVDEHGNEIKDEEPEEKVPVPQKASNIQTFAGNLFTPQKQKNSAVDRKPKFRNSARKDKPTKQSSKLESSGAKKNTKRKTKKISSYFSQKP